MILVQEVTLVQEILVQEVILVQEGLFTLIKFQHPDNKMEGTCNQCVFPLNKDESADICPTHTSLVYAAWTGKLSCVKELIAAGADVNTGCDWMCHGNPALLSVTYKGYVECVKELIGAGADINKENLVIQL